MQSCPQKEENFTEDRKIRFRMSLFFDHKLFYVQRESTIFYYLYNKKVK